jgi:hypothetical protein
MEIQTTQGQAPKGAVFTLIVPLNREKTEFARFHMKDLDEQIYLGARALLDKDKDYDAVRMLIKGLLVQPSDDPKILETNFVAMRSAQQMVAEILRPVEGELKKN